MMPGKYNQAFLYTVKKIIDPRRRAFGDGHILFPVLLCRLFHPRLIDHKRKHDDHDNDYQGGEPDGYSKVLLYEVCKRHCQSSAPLAFLSLYSLTPITIYTPMAAPREIRSFVNPLSISITRAHINHTTRYVTAVRISCILDLLKS